MFKDFFQPNFGYVAGITAIIGALAAILNSYLPLSKHFTTSRNEFKSELTLLFQKIYMPALLGLKQPGNFFFNNNEEIILENLNIISQHGYLLPTEIAQRFTELYLLEISLKESELQDLLQEHEHLKQHIYHKIEKSMLTTKLVYTNMTDKVAKKYTTSFTEKFISFLIDVSELVAVIVLIKIALDIYGKSVGLPHMGLVEYLMTLLILMVFVTAGRIFWKYYLLKLFNKDNFPDKMISATSLYRCNVCGYSQKFIKYQAYEKCKNRKSKRAFHFIFYHLEILWRKVNEKTLLIASEEQND